jgi:hypothetical protein
MYGKGVAEAAATKASGQTMNSTGKGDDHWIKIQQKTFTNWANTQVLLNRRGLIFVQLEPSGGKISDLGEDFKTGVNLILVVRIAESQILILVA